MHVRHGQPHHDCGDEPSVVAHYVARGSHAYHRSELARGAEHFAEPELAQQEPEHGNADDPAYHAGADADEELSDLVPRALVGGR